MQVRKIKTQICEDWEDASHFINKMIRSHGDCIVKISPHIPVQSSAAHGYELVFYSNT